MGADGVLAIMPAHVFLKGNKTWGEKYWNPSSIQARLRRCKSSVASLPSVTSWLLPLLLRLPPEEAFYDPLLSFAFPSWGSISFLLWPHILWYLWCCFFNLLWSLAYSHWSALLVLACCVFWYLASVGVSSAVRKFIREESILVLDTAAALVPSP